MTIRMEDEVRDRLEQFAEATQRSKSFLAAEAIRDEQTLHDIVNKLHDLKHAFDVQKLEIEHYYARKGNYVPRQFVDFFAV